MKVAIGADHRGFKLKSILKEYLEKELGIEVIDVGTDSEDSTHYPIYAYRVAELIKRNQVDFGILICYTGIGMSIAANKIKGIRAALVWHPELARLSRLHNNANVICLSGGFIEPNKAREFVKTFLTTPFEGGRHSTRLAMITELEIGQKLKEQN